MPDLWETEEVVELCLLLLLPVLVGLGGLIFGKHRINWKEFLVQEGVVIIFIVAGFFLGRCSQSRDVEVWSGEVTGKKKVRVHCRHSYPCNPHPCMCTTTNGVRTCSTCYDTCYVHSYDNDWRVFDSAGMTYTIATIDSQGLNEPPRWTAAYVGEPTASTHAYQNYIKGNPWTIIKRTGAAEKYRTPGYPKSVYNYYYVDRFVSTINVPEAKKWNEGLANLNAKLGRKKQVNVIVVVTDVSDSEYLHALEEVWLGGKKNDFVIIVGTPRYPQIEWVRVMSWTRAEELKIVVRDRLQEIGTLEKRDEILAVISEEVQDKFVRRPMSDFKYLSAGIRPPMWVMFLVFFLGLAASVGLTIYFYKFDPFGR